jgi:hypothetical protein
VIGRGFAGLDLLSRVTQPERSGNLPKKPEKLSERSEFFSGRQSFAERRAPAVARRAMAGQEPGGLFWLLFWTAPEK